LTPAEFGSPGNVGITLRVMGRHAERDDHLTKQGQQAVDLVWETEPMKHPRKHPAPTIVPIDSGLLEDVEGFVDDPEAWFRRPNAEFQGRRPVDLLGTSDEPRLRNRIEAAKLGMFA
jgi:hypothetical protein